MLHYEQYVTLGDLKHSTLACVRLIDRAFRERSERKNISAVILHKVFIYYVEMCIYSGLGNVRLGHIK